MATRMNSSAPNNFPRKESGEYPLPSETPQDLSEADFDGTQQTQATEPPAPQKSPRAQKGWLTVREMAIFAMFGALIFCSKLLMEWAPNVHFIALFIITFTVVYRAKALVPIYIFVLLTGVYGGFNLWWIPYLYIWLPLWGAAMLLPRRMPVKVAVPVYMVVGALHGLCYGTLYAPAQALFFHLNFQATLTWIVAGLPWDGVHAAGNFAACTLVLPLAKLLCRLEHKPTPWRLPSQ